MSIPVFLTGTLLIFIYALDPFNTPSTNRSSTTWLMCEHGARPVWLGYVHVDDVDNTLAKLQELGGKVLMLATEIPQVGRLAMVADPQGAPFYIMSGAVKSGASTAFGPMTRSYCSLLLPEEGDHQGHQALPARRHVNGALAHRQAQGSLEAQAGGHGQ